MELFKGINQIKLPLLKVGPENVNVYIIEGDEGNLLIDTGWNTPEAFNALAQEMKNSGFAMKDITDIVVTHFHPDHIGLAGKIAEITGAKIALSEIENNLLDSRYMHPESLIS
jgi:glyoxylase-like metal-dependent hydrolase (beta-lactamase superfamily II)